MATQPLPEILRRSMKRLRETSPRLQEGIKFRKTNRHALSNNNIEKYFETLVTAVYPFDLTNKPSEEVLAQVQKWIATSCPKDPQTKVRFVGEIKGLDVHPEITECILHPPINEEKRKLFEEVQKKLPSTRNRFLSKDQFFTHYLSLCRLHPQPPPRPSECGDLTMEQAVKYCTEGRRNGPVRPVLLACSGFRHGYQNLLEKIQLRRDDDERYGALKKELESQGITTSSWKLCYHEEMLRLLGRPEEVATDVTGQQILDRLATVNRGRRCMFQMFRQEMLRLGKAALVEKLDTCSDYYITSKTRHEQFRARSPWHHQLFIACIDSLMQESQGKTAFTAVRRNTLEQSLAHFFFFLETHARGNLETFLENVAPPQLLDALKDYARSLKGYGRRSKALSNGHHATSTISFALRALRCDGMIQFLGCAQNLSGFSIRKVLQTIENNTIPADPSVRRRFTDEEVGRMMELARDPAQDVMLTILREVAVRATALGQIKYEMLVDENHAPRSLCKVPEKNNKLRCFKASENLTKKIQILTDQLRRTHTDEELVGCFPLHMNNIQVPYSRANIYAFVRNLAKRANVTDVQVHPHAFRHTLVCKLVDAGNSLDIVSKFMGHESTSTTRNKYWTLSTEEIHQRLVDPFMVSFHQDKEKKITIKEAEVLTNQKVLSCIKIIGKYQQILEQCTRENQPAAQVGDRIQQELPHLTSILAIIKDSVQDPDPDPDPGPEPELLGPEESSSEEDSD